MAPSSDESGPVTLLIAEASGGSKDAEAQLYELVYTELHRRAEAFVRGARPGDSIQATALVNEVYLRLTGQRKKDWASRAHFLGVASHLMRLIVIDRARMQKAQRRGGEMQRVMLDNLDELRVFDPSQFDDLVRLDDALKVLAESDPRAMKVVECRFFAGMSVPATAAYLKISGTTVKNEWQYARAWLAGELTRDSS